MKIVTSWHALMELTKEVGNARRSNNKERIRKAEAAHDAYVRICLNSDEMCLHVRNGDL